MYVQQTVIFHLSNSQKIGEKSKTNKNSKIVFFLDINLITFKSSVNLYSKIELNTSCLFLIAPFLLFQ